MMKYISIFFLTIFLCACNNDALNTVNIEDKYEIEVPEFTKEVAHLSPDASLQYANATNDLCLMVIDDSKEDFQEKLFSVGLQDEFPNTIDGITDYLQVAQKAMIGDNGQIDYSPVQTVSINGLDARQYTIEATIEGEELYYLYTIVDGETHYYQILSWTYLNQKNQYQDLFLEVSQSFKEL